MIAAVGLNLPDLFGRAFIFCFLSLFFHGFVFRVDSLSPKTKNQIFTLFIT